MTPAVAFKNVCFSYNHQEVLHDASFEIRHKSFVSVVGPNGGGKTTLLRLMLGLQTPEKGQVGILGKTPVHARKSIGYVMQHLQYDDRFPATVMDVTLMGCSGLRRFGRYGFSEKRRSIQALQQVEMDTYKSRPFSQLSGGQRQRVLVAQALVSKPELILLDEPTANIDAKGEKVLNSLLHELAKSFTVIVVSHNVNTVLDCSSHVLCVNRTVDFNTIENLNPELLARVRGGGIAVLHHELSCQVFDKQLGETCHHKNCHTCRGEKS